MFSVDENFVNSSEDRVSFGPRVGFMESMATSYDASTRETMDGILWKMSPMYSEQDKRLRSLGESEIPTLNRVDPRDLAAVYSGEDDAPNLDMNEVSAYDKKITELRAKYPDQKFLTTQDMWNEVRTAAQEAARLDSEQRRTVAGSIGGFVGGVGAAFDPRYNFVNAVTLPFGGVGKTAVTRSLSEGGVQSGIEAINEFTGQREARRMLGLDSSWEGTVSRIALTGAGGTVIRGLGEGGVAGFKAGRRWFSDTPKDPAPLPPMSKMEPEVPLTPQQQHTLNMSRLDYTDPSLARTRVGASRVISDLDEVTRTLDDWAGDLPINMKPRSETAIPLEGDGLRFSDDVRTRETLGELTIDEMARRVDPDTFRIYDNLAAKVNDLRGQIDTLRPGDDVQREAVADLSDRIDELTARIDKGSKAQVARKTKTLGAEREALIAEREAILTELRTTDTPEMATLRKELIATDYKMRDMAPTVSRAYARARGEWELGQEYKKAVGSMVRRGETRLPDSARNIPEDKAPPPSNPFDGMPIASRVQPDKIGSGDSFTDAANRAAADDVKALEETLTTFRESLASIKEDTDKIMIGNHEIDLKQRVEVPNKDGEGSREISVKQLLEEIRETDEDLKAITKCST